MPVRNLFCYSELLEFSEFSLSAFSYFILTLGLYLILLGGDIHTPCVCIVVFKLYSCVSASAAFDSGVANWQHVATVALMFPLLSSRLQIGQAECVYE